MTWAGVLAYAGVDAVRLEKASMGKAAKADREIAAALIARNEARSIVRCLDSVRPWVDRIVLLDTGSTDDTAQLARRSGAEVHHCDWPGDFSAARNRVLDLAGAEWNLILDADEWIETGGDLLRGWCQGTPKLGRACVHSAFDAEDAIDARPATRSWLTRILPAGVRFRGRVHEQAVSSLPRERIDLHLGHDGYLDAQLASKRGRNLPLLMLDLQDNPGDPYIAYQLGKETEGAERFGEACEWYGQALAATLPNATWFHELLVRQLHCLGQAGRIDDALRLANANSEAGRDSPDYYFTLGDLALDKAMADPAHAIGDWLPLAISAWERCTEIGERPDLEGSVHGRGSHLAQHNLDLVRQQMAMLKG
jgi:tetratricopeptide (TPR) repeat protein